MKKIINFITKNKAFTLTEMVVTIAVIITLAVVWAFYGRGHVKYAMMNEGRLFIEKIVAQEREYFNEHGNFKTESNYTPYSKDLYIDTKENKYFSAFKIENNTSEGGKIIVSLSSFSDNNSEAMKGVYYIKDSTFSYTENINKLQ